MLILAACQMTYPSIHNRGTLSLQDNQRVLSSGTYSGRIYSGSYHSPDGINLDVWISIRQPDSIRNIGIVPRIGVQIQGGTGSKIINALNGDQGKSYSMDLY